MYLTGGQYKGRKIESAKSARSTLSKVRESVFNILVQYDTKEKKFLDMFAGSGIIALEAASRGYFVKALEINPKNLQIIKKNSEKLNLKIDTVLCNSLKFDGEKFNIIYLDPPWEKDYSLIIKKAAELLEKGGLIIVEHDSNIKTNLTSVIEKEKLSLKIIKSKKYGRCLIDILTNCNIM